MVDSMGDLLILFAVAVVGFLMGRSRSRYDAGLEHERYLFNSLCCGESVSITRRTQYGEENITIIKEYDGDDDDDDDDSSVETPTSPFDCRHPVPSCENN